MTKEVPYKYATSIGIELTFVPSFMEDIHYQQKDYKLGRKTDPRFRVTDSIDGHKRVCEGFAMLLSNALVHNKVPHFKCIYDPGCVEVPTNPYRTEKTLEKAVRAIMNEAADLYLQPVSEYICGKGAHIHVGNPKSDPEMFQKRVMLWGNRNPWAAWAFADLLDNQNANAIPVRVLKVDMESFTEEELYEMIEIEKSDIVRLTTELYDSRRFWRWGSSKQRTKLLILKCQNKILDLRRKILDHRYGRADTLNISDIHTQESKMYFISCRGNTTEFRMFSMTEDVEGILRQARFADAVYRLLVADTSKTFKADTLIDYDRFESMKYSEAATGFNRMLDELGLDRDDYRANRVHIALRMRAFRSFKGNTELWG